MNRLPDIQSALQSDDEEVRRRAIHELSGLPLRTSCPLLFNSMGDSSWRIRKDAVEVFVASGPESDTISELLELLRCEENAGLRNSAAEAVTRLGVRAADPLIHLASDQDADVRKFVIDVMGSIGNNIFIPVLLNALQDTDVNVAAAAAEHLGNLGDGRVVQDLIQSIISNTSDLFRFSALAALGKLAAPAPVPEEIRQLADHDLLRKAVYDCLGSIADDSSLYVLLEGLAVRQKSCRNAALIAIYRVYTRSNPEARKVIETSLQMLRGGDIIPVLTSSFDPRETTLAEALIVLLDIVGDKRCVEIFLQAFSNERLARVAIQSLKNLGPDGIDSLVSRYDGFDEESRTAICSLIGACAYHSGSSILPGALRDASAEVRRAAVISIGKLGMKDCIPAIVQLLDDNDQEVRNSVITCLQALALIDRSGIQSVAGQIGGSDQPELRRNAAILYAALGDGEQLSLLAKDENDLVREAAVVSIGKLHFTDGMGTLLFALVDENPDVRIAAAEGLGFVGDETVMDALSHALADEDTWVQCAALKSIAKIQPQASYGAVNNVFSDADGLLMITCLELLDELGNTKSLDLVEQALNRTDDEIVSLSLKILSQHDVNRIFPHAERLLDSPNWNIRIACARAVAQLSAEQARELLSAALEKESNDLVRSHMQNLLKDLA